MKTLFLFILGCLIGLHQGHSQSFETDLEAKEHIKKLDFLVGKWEGSGWRIGQDGIKHNFDQTENVQFKINSTAILIEGKGFSNGQVIHNAMAVVTSDEDSGQYEFQSYLQNGMKGSFKAEIIEDKFYWYPNENVRYIISINEQGQWFETGEYNRSGNWMQFFEMSLSKI